MKYRETTQLCLIKHLTADADVIITICGQVGKSPTILFSPKIIWWGIRSEEHTTELQSRQYLVCRLLLEKKKNINKAEYYSITAYRQLSLQLCAAHTRY